MAHPYALHRPVDAECLCCHVRTKFTFTSRSEQVMCALCKRHWGAQRPDELRQRDRDHVGLWRADQQRLVDDHARRVVRLEALVHDRDTKIQTLNERVAHLDGALAAAVEGRPTEALGAWAESAKVTKLEEGMARKDGFIARIFGVLYNIDSAHHSDDQQSNDICLCGAKSCEVSRALSPFRNTLYKWENEQVARIKDGKRHSLPIEHPAVLQYEPWRRDRPA